MKRGRADVLRFVLSKIKTQGEAAAVHKIFCIMGKSASGKDTIYEKLLQDTQLSLKKIIMYTTRPIRDQEQEGREYHFCTDEEHEALRQAGKIIEERYYDTVYGRWYYFTADDGQIDLTCSDCLIPGVLQSYLGMASYFGKDAVVPLYIEVEDGTRLLRAIGREKKQKQPKYEEMCRRFLSDTKDFSEEKLQTAGITRRFDNTGELTDCLRQLKGYIKEQQECNE